MELADLKRSYQETTAALQQTHVAALIAGTVLEDFPRNLPQPTKGRLINLMQQLSKLLITAADRADKGINTPGKSRKASVTKVGSVAAEEDDPLVSRILMMMLTAGTGGADLEHLDFAPLLFAQDLVTTLAHLDGFTADILKMICAREPRVLRRRKQVTWEAVLDAGSWDGVVERFVEDYAFEIGWKSLTERLQHFSDEVGLAISADPEDLETLENAYQLRHIIVHSGSRVTREFLQRTRRTDVTIGARVTVDADYAARASSSAVMICGDLFVATAAKFFGATDRDMTAVWRRTAKPTQRGAG